MRQQRKFMLQEVLQLQNDDEANALSHALQIAKRSSRRSLMMSRGGGTTSLRGLAAWAAVPPSLRWRPALSRR